jgi:RING-variant domain
LILKEGNYYVGNCFDGSQDKKIGPDNIEDPEQIENGVWLVVRSFKAQSSNKSVKPKSVRHP